MPTDEPSPPTIEEVWQNLTPELRHYLRWLNKHFSLPRPIVYRVPWYWRAYFFIRRCVVHKMEQ